MQRNQAILHNAGYRRGERRIVSDTYGGERLETNEAKRAMRVAGGMQSS